MPYQSNFRPGLFKDKVVIVTGGGSGIGRCTAHELASLGAHVAIVGRKVEKLITVAAEIAEDGGSCSTHVCDIRDEPVVIQTIDDVLSRFGRIDGLVNNAGGQYPSEMKNISTKGFEAVVRNNLTGGFIFMREVYNRWMEQHGGSIVNIIADIWNGWPNFAHSAAGRGGMFTLSETAACEWAHANVRVNSLAPGVIASSGFDTYSDEAWVEVRKMIARLPMGRPGTESEVAAAIVFLLSPAAAYITGTCVRVDGAHPNARQSMTPRAAGNKTPFNGFHRAGPVRQ